MNKSKDEVQQIFNEFDKDQSGTIEKEEIDALAKSMGIQLTPNKLQKIMQVIDSNGDGKISFDEFYEYFLYGVQKDMDKLIYAKFNHIKKLKTLKKQVSTDYAHIFDQVIQEGKAVTNIKVNVGDVQNAQTTSEFALRVGQENKHFSESILKHFPLLSDNTVQLVFGLKCANSDVVAEKLNTFVDEAIELAFTMLPDKAIEALTPFREFLKFEYKALPGEVLVRVHFENDIAESILENYKDFSTMFLNEQSSLLLKFTFELLTNLSEIAANPEENVLNLINKGFIAGARLEIDSGSLKQLRGIYNHQLIQTKDKNNSDSRTLRNLAPLILLENCNLELTLNSFQQFIEEFGIPNHAKLSKAIEQSKKVNINELVANVPFVADVLDVLRTEASTNFFISVITLEASVTITAKTSGVADIWDKLL